MLWTVLLPALHAAHESGGIYDPTVLHSLERAGYDRTFEAIEARGATQTDSQPEPTFGSWRRITLDDTAHSVDLPGRYGNPPRWQQPLELSAEDRPQVRVYF